MDVSILAEACRCCLTENQPMQSLFDKFTDIGPKIDPNLTYSDAIYLCTNIEVDTLAGSANEMGSLPQNICIDCLRELRLAILFRAKCEETDAMLRKHVRIDVASPSESENIIIEGIEYNVEHNVETLQNTQDNGKSVIIMDNAPISSTIGDSNNHNERYIISYESRIDSVIAENPTGSSKNTANHRRADDVESYATPSSSRDYHPMRNKRTLPMEKNWFECELCKKGFPIQKALNKHIEFAHSGRTLHLCNVCGQLCSNDASLKAHMLQHQDKKFNCNDCSKGYISKKGLDNHRLQHQNILPEKKFLCSDCGQGFTTNQRLSIHMFTHTGERNHSCDVCNKAFATESRLRSHRRIHTGERPFECGLCGLKFAQSNALKCHKRIHTGERPFKCKFCDKAFSQQTILKTHLTLHTGKTVKCPDCDKKFSRASYLILHRREHSGERPYACDRCDNRYKQKSHLDRHIDTHLNVKHKCLICNKEYSKRWSLKMHMFTHSEKKPFQCTECQVSFVRKDKYRAHIKNFHHDVDADAANGPKNDSNTSKS